MKIFALFYVLMLVNYLVATVNVRMIAKGRYLGTVATDAGIALIGFTLIQHVAKADTVIAQAGYVLGGMTGSALGLWLTKDQR